MGVTGTRKIKNICMVGYTNLSHDARPKREAETLVHHGFRVYFINLHDEREPPVCKRNGVVLLQVKTKKYAGKNQLRYFLSYIDFFIRSFLKVSALTLRGRVDAVHIHNMPDFMVFTALLPRLQGKMVVLDVHDSMPETYAGKFHGLSSIINRLLVLEEKVSTIFSQKVICVNHVQMEPLLQRKIPRKKITICMNVPDHTIFNESTRMLDRPIGDTFNVIYHGTIDTTLGIDIAIRAMVPLSKRIPSIKFHIIGRGKDVQQFRDLIVDLGIEKHINLSTNMRPVAEVPAMLRDMHVGLIPNRKNLATEFMLPVKLLEYISVGIPSVAPRLRTIEYYFSEEMVGLYEPENIDSMADAIYRLYADQPRRMAQAKNALSMLDKYGWEKQQYDLLAMYR
jgi:glycosyltransferase involved in cell wall biosynthesis